MSRQRRQLVRDLRASRGMGPASSLKKSKLVHNIPAAGTPASQLRFVARCICPAAGGSGMRWSCPYKIDVAV